MGLDVLLQIYGTGQLTYHMPSGWGDRFPDNDVAFKKDFHERHSANTKTAWVATLSSRLVALVLWMTGEYCARFPSGFEEKGEIGQRVTSIEFGSVVHGYDTENNDLDILIDLTSETTLFDSGAIRQELLQLLGVPVDVLTPNALPEKFRLKVLNEAVPV